MKKFLQLCIFVFILAGCQNDELPLVKGNISFSLSNQSRKGGRTTEVATPAFVLLTIKSSKGEVVMENKKLALFSFGQGYVSESLELSVGSYQLTQFVILDADNKAIYATPLEGSDLAKYVANSLPIEFIISENANIKVVPQVIAVEPDDTLESFGYVSFGFEIVKTKLIKKVETRSSVDHQVLGYTVYSYDNSKRIKTMIQYTLEEDQYLKGLEVLYEYEKGYLQKLTRIQSNGQIAEYLYFYNNGKLDKVESYSGGILNTVRKFEYSEDKLKIIPYSANGIGGSSYHEYLFNGNNISQYSFFENGAIKKCFNYTYVDDAYNPYFQFAPLFFKPFPSESTDESLPGIVNSAGLIADKFSCNSVGPIASYKYKLDSEGYPAELKNSTSTGYLKISYY